MRLGQLGQDQARSGDHVNTMPWDTGYAWRRFQLARVLQEVIRSCQQRCACVFFFFLFGGEGSRWHARSGLTAGEAAPEPLPRQNTTYSKPMFEG